MGDLIRMSYHSNVNVERVVERVLNRGERGARALLVAVLEDAIDLYVRNNAEAAAWIFGETCGGEGFDFEDLVELLGYSPKMMREEILDKRLRLGVSLDPQRDLFYDWTGTE